MKRILIGSIAWVLLIINALIGCVMFLIFKIITINEKL